MSTEELLLRQEETIDALATWASYLVEELAQFRSVEQEEEKLKAFKERKETCCTCHRSCKASSLQ